MPDIIADDPRSDVEAAWDSVSNREAEAAPEPVAEVAVPVEPIGETTEQAAARARDEKGRFAKSIGEEEKPAKVEEKPAPKVAEAKPEAKVVTPPAEPTPNPEPAKPKFKPPSSLRPTSREAWEKVPPEVQEDIDRVDREVRKVMQESAQARQFHERYRESVAPYEPVFRSIGVSAEQAIGMSLQTLGVLASGPPAIKAKELAKIIKAYNVDIGMLDSELAGVAPSAPQPTYDPDMIRREAAAAAQQQIEALKSQALMSQAERAYQEFMADPPEFFEDVRADMEKLLRAGIASDYRDAYNKAAEWNPSVKRVLDQRRTASTSNGATQRAVVAASSVKPQPASGPRSNPNSSLEDDVKDAWEKVMGRK